MGATTGIKKLIATSAVLQYNMYKLNINDSLFLECDRYVKKIKLKERALRFEYGSFDSMYVDLRRDKGSLCYT